LQVKKVGGAKSCNFPTDKKANFRQFWHTGNCKLPTKAIVDAKNFINFLPNFFRASHHIDNNFRTRKRFTKICLPLSLPLRRHMISQGRPETDRSFRFSKSRIDLNFWKSKIRFPRFVFKIQSCRFWGVFDALKLCCKRLCHEVSSVARLHVTELLWLMSRSYRKKKLFARVIIHLSKLSAYKILEMQCKKHFHIWG